MFPTPFRLLIVDDHPVVLFGLRLLFQGHPTVSIVAEATTAAQARALTERFEPDFVVTDLVMGERDGIDLVEDLVAIHPAVRILVYSSHDERSHAGPALGAGARGYLSKTDGLDCIAFALERIAGGGIVVSPRMQETLIKSYARPGPPAGDGLSRRERQVLECIGRGASLSRIAEDLGLSVKTVGTYRERLKIKLGFDSLRMLERYADDVRAGRTGR